MWDMSYKMSFSATCVSVRMRVHGCRTCSLTTNHSTKMAAIPSGPPSSRYPSRPRSSHEETIEELKRRHKVCQSHVSCDQPGQSRVDHSAEHIPKLSSASGDLSLPLPLVVDGCDSACLDEAYHTTSEHQWPGLLLHPAAGEALLQRREWQKQSHSSMLWPLNLPMC